MSLLRAIILRNAAGQERFPSLVLWGNTLLNVARFCASLPRGFATKKRLLLFVSVLQNLSIFGLSWAGLLQKQRMRICCALSFHAETKWRQKVKLFVRSGAPHGFFATMALSLRQKQLEASLLASTLVICRRTLEASRPFSPAARLQSIRLMGRSSSRAFKIGTAMASGGMGSSILGSIPANRDVRLQARGKLQNSRHTP